MSITEELQRAIIPGRILAVQVGLSRTAVLAEAEDGIRCGLAATLSNPELDNHHQPSVRQAGHLHEIDYAELAGLIESDSFTEVAIGLATINALLPRDASSWVELNAEDYLVQNGAGKNVAMVGHFPVVNRLRACAGNLWVLELRPKEGDLPAEAAAEVIPQADIVAITGTTLINKTFDGLIKLCRPTAEVIMLGPSTPLSPVLHGHGVRMIAGTIVLDPQKTVLGIGQGISLHQLHQTGWIKFVTMKKE
ncbi:MAG TPA: DUF364 domain-containing protein [Longilinea sp.]|nr:DUF364 domain-containing protein [Longilinea sp.]